MADNKYFEIQDGVLTKYNGEEENVTIPNGVKVIGDSAFYRCSSITSLTILKGVTSIKDNAFYECENLKEVILPLDLNEIGCFAFYDCKKLQTITIPLENISIGPNAFKGCNIKTILLPEGEKEIKQDILAMVDENSTLQSIVLPKTISKTKADLSYKEENEINSYSFTDTPVFMYGEKGETYILFGDWPQTIKEDNVTIDETHIYNINGWESYRGSDGYYYVKEIAYPDTDANEIGETVYYSAFSNDKIIQTKKSYYFKLECIKWRVLSNNFQRGTLLIADKALTAGCFYTDKNNARIINGKKVYPNNYEYSRIRAYLNSLDGRDYSVEDFRGRGFIDKAFTKKARDRINTVKVDNGKYSTTDNKNKLKTADEYICNDTNDKVFLLSEREATTEVYGFDSYELYMGDEFGTTTSNRIRFPTDYAKAMGAWYTHEYEDEEKGECIWFLRSPSCDSISQVYDVGGYGDVEYCDDVSFIVPGIVPVISISLSKK